MKFSLKSSYFFYPLGAILVLGAILFWNSPARDRVLNGASRENTSAQASVVIAGTKISVEVAEDTASREKGLSGRISLAAESGMFFIFPRAGSWRFWMPNMNFPIDIIWIEDGKVVGIEADVSNEFDPVNPRFYVPPKPVQYVLEVNAGFAKSKNVKVGDKVIFHL